MIYFLGDFAYIPGYRSECYQELRQILHNCVIKFHKSRVRLPVNIIVYYQGLNEGVFQQAYKYTIPFIKDGIQVGAENKDIPLTLIAVLKKNGIRLFPEQVRNSITCIMLIFKFPSNDKAPNYDFNVPQGTVVDTSIVSPVFNEFYLMPHLNPDGTANVPRYTILANEVNFNLNELEQITHFLCYEHQIDGVVTSLPTPLMVASEYGQRGRDIFNAA